MKLKLILSIVAVVIVIAIIFFAIKPNSTGNVIEDTKTTDIDEISIPLSEITSEARWYTHEADGKYIKYFAVKTENGEIKTAFDACDVCHKSKKGYRQEGGDMICNNCGNHYAISGLGTKNTKGGGCWPGYLPSDTDKENLIIKTSDLEKGKYRF
ncbi:DUF2318 domain-containing protein [Candidatus Pacearchaeota archaeon]|nr:DUF2318 domain-containing protein [Candidatus Pacearchaeota archaeon]